jgi:predicted nucleic acid-binding protein
MAKDKIAIVSAQVAAETRAELERHAAAGYRNLSAEIRLAIDEHLRRAEQARDKAEACTSTM